MLQFLPYTLHQGPLTLSRNERTEPHGVRPVQASIIRVDVTVDLVVVVGHCSTGAFTRRHTCQCISSCSVINYS